MTLAEWVATILGSGLISGATILAGLKFLGERWISAKFEERLAHFKHEQQKEIERLRHRINTLMDRTTKLHQREFDILPEAWGQLNDVMLKIESLTFRFDPNLDAFREDQLDEFLNDSDLSSWERSQVKVAPEKTKRYGEFIKVKLFDDALSASNKFSVYLRKNGIFIERNLRNSFEKIEELIHGALAEQTVNMTQKRNQWEKFQVLNKEGKPLVKSLDQEVQARLWDADTIP